MTLSKDLGRSKAVSSSLLAVPPSNEPKDPGVPNAVQVILETEVMTNPIPCQASPVFSTDASGRHFFESSSGFCNDVGVSSFSPLKRDSRNFPFISSSLRGESSIPQLSSEGASFTPNRASYSEIQSPALTVYTEYQSDMSWCPDSLQCPFDLSDHVTVQNAHMESNGQFMASGNEFKRTDSIVWAEQLLSAGDAPDQDLSELLADIDAQNIETKMLNPTSDFMSQQLQVHEQPLVLSTEQSAVAIPLSSAAPSANSARPRMRWTQELHEKFVEAVNELGGSERATPKGVQRLMSVPGLTIYHVKSHLQKYRTARYKPESSEGPSEKKSSSIDDMETMDLDTSMGITEALRLQIELQKHLHEQLESQRKLQLQLEEQARYLQMMFKKQQKMQGKSSKASSSTPGDPLATSAYLSQPSFAIEPEEPNTKPESGCLDLSKKRKMPETKSNQDSCPDFSESSFPHKKQGKKDEESN